MKVFILTFILIFFMGDLVIFDFNKSKANKLEWYIVNDGVMGGLSQSTINLSSDGRGVFEGKVSLENNGGFAMTQLNCNIKDIENYSKIVLQLEGDGKKYQFRIKDKRNNYYSYTKDFTTSGKSEMISLKLSDFKPYFRGRKLNMPNFEANTIEQVAILIGNKKAENFRLEIDKVSLE